VQPKLVYGENVRQALQFVQTGAAEAGIVAWSIVEVPEVAWTPVDPRLHAPLNQMAVVVARSPRRERASTFLRFVTGAEGRAVLRRYGFVLPGEPREAVNE
jgi:molybdate transport system substrate-binding protein